MVFAKISYKNLVYTTKQVIGMMFFFTLFPYLAKSP